MRLSTFPVAITLLTSMTGCQQLPTRKPPEVPKVAAASDAPGEQKVMMQMMQQMAEDDAGSIRK